MENNPRLVVVTTVFNCEDYEGLDDLEAWKEEEQKVIDELIQRMQGAYNDV
jgi:antirestriction protein ArdC